MTSPTHQAILMASNGAGANALAFLARTSGLNAAHTNAYIALINGLDTDGLFSKFDLLHIYATQDSTTALLNLVSTNYNGTAIGSPTFTADRGFTGVAGSSSVYIDTGFNPNVASSPQFVNNSAHVSAWSVADIGVQGNAIIGGFKFGIDETDIYPRFTDGNAYFRANVNGGGAVANASGAGHYTAARSSSGTGVQGYKNGSSVMTNSLASAGVPNGNIYTLGLNNGTNAIGSAFQCAEASIGSNLTSTDVTNFYNRLRTFMTTVGVP